MIGYAFCGSFCTLGRSIGVMKGLIGSGEEVLPIVSDAVYTTDTRFAPAAERIAEIEDATGRTVIRTVKDAEPLGPETPLEALIVAPCTGNTLAKIANGITDTPVTMAVKAHLRQDRPLLIALATNDALSQNLGNLAKLLTRKSVYFLPMRQDAPIGKPYSLVAEFERIPEALAAMREGVQLMPLFVQTCGQGGAVKS